MEQLVLKPAHDTIGLYRSYRHPVKFLNGIIMRLKTPRSATTKDVNKLLATDRPAHDWYRFVLSYPPHLVRSYLDRFGIDSKQRVLDPFCGTGTTLVECKKLGVPSVGIEANPMAHLASSVKTDWSIDPQKLQREAENISQRSLEQLRRQGIVDEQIPLLQSTLSSSGLSRSGMLQLSEECQDILLSNSISPKPLHKTLLLLGQIQACRQNALRPYLLLALAKAVVYRISNLRFGPEVGLGVIKEDAEVVGAWMDVVETMVADIELLQGSAVVPAQVIQGDSRDIGQLLEPESIDAVITSPPYPNEKDYSRTTRLESVLLGLIKSNEELRKIKKSFVRSNTRSVYQSDADDAFVAEHDIVQGIASEIENRRIEMGKTSGFERLYGRVTKLYFGGMARHLADLRKVLKPGAMLAYVVGDQASYLRVMIRTGQILGSIAESLGYELEAIDLFRTRQATATRDQLREEVVVLRWPAKKRSTKRS
jgi:hypothetical protein